MACFAKSQDQMTPFLKFGGLNGFMATTFEDLSG